MDIWKELERYREDGHVEAKEALGGLPESLWESYCGFANAQGGVILLGVGENPDHSLRVLALQDPDWLLEDFWAIINDPRKVSVNLLTQEDVQVIREDGKCIIAIFVPEAAPEQKPVYLDGDPWRHTYRRVGEADKRCSVEEVEEMMKKFVFFDTNSCTEYPGVYPIDEMTVKARKLAEGDLVTAYMLGEHEYWDAKIVRHSEQWRIVLLSKAREISAERYAGQQEGYWDGKAMEKLRTLRVLENMGLPADLMEELKRRLELV